jgi:hypothetical protein
MAITLGALVLPSGLVWSDEFAWTPVAQTMERTLTGALVIEEAAKTAGRPITLTGAKAGADYTALVARGQAYRGFSSLNALRTALVAPGASFTLTLHDSRTFTVAPRQDADGPLSVESMPAYKDFAPADPDDASLYFVAAIRLIEI